MFATNRLRLGPRSWIDAGAIGEVMATQVFGAANKPDSYWTEAIAGGCRRPGASRRWSRAAAFC